MKKNKKVILSCTIVLVLVISFLSVRSSYKEEASFEDNTSKSKHIVNENTLSMMIEQTAGAGDYKMEERTSWPTEGYKFNAVLSKCENGGKLGWDETKGVITMTGNMSDKCYIYFDKYSYGVVNNFTYTATSSSLTITASATKGENEISTYYFSIDNGSTYNESSTNTYTFSDLTKGTTYTIKIKVKDSLNKVGSVYSGTATTENIVLLADYIKSLYNNGNNNIYYHDSTRTERQSLQDNSYRYVGASSEVNNYVCFGSTDATCPTDNLYRIIGVFEDQVKLIKAVSIGQFIWSEDDDSLLETSEPNNYLNGEYLTSLGDYAKKIATTAWKVAYASVNINNAFYWVYYDEIKECTEEYSAKIGLMYITDYVLAINESYYPTLYEMKLNNLGGYTSKNWMYIGVDEWTISHSADSMYYVTSEGNVSYSDVIDWDSYAVRPTFYLNSGVTYVSGSGSNSDPIRVS